MLKDISKVLFVASLFAIQLFVIACSSDSGSGEGGDGEQDTVVVVDTVLTEAVALTDTNQVIDTMKLRAEKAANDFKKIFRKYGVEGAFLLFDPQENQRYIHNEARISQPFLPASTFKILNSMIALETGVIADTNTVLRWDGTERDFEEWNKDHDMQSAFRYSVVWFYQELARRVGMKRMQHYVSQANYGNKRIEGGIDHFWLDGKIRITMEEQITFLRRLYQGRTPFSWETMQKVRAIMEYERKDNYVIRGKTGWAQPKGEQEFGWFVGWVERPDEKGYYFALNIDIEKPEDLDARVGITKEILEIMEITTLVLPPVEEPVSADSVVADTTGN